MNMMRLFVKYRFYGSIVLLIIGILIQIFVHKGHTWSIFIYIISVSIILFDIFIYQEELRGDIGQLLDIEGAKEKSKKAKPLSQTLKATPILREFHYWLSAISEDYADFMEIDQPKVQLE